MLIIFRLSVLREQWIEEYPLLPFWPKFLFKQESSCVNAYRPPRSKYSSYCSCLLGKGVPHPVLLGGVPHPVMLGGGGVPHPVPFGVEVPHPVLASGEGTPVHSWHWGTPIQSQQGVPHTDLSGVTSRAPSCWMGVPPSGVNRLKTSNSPILRMRAVISYRVLRNVEIIHWDPVIMSLVSTDNFLCIGIIDSNGEKFGYNEHPLRTNSFFCLFLLGTQCVENVDPPRETQYIIVCTVFVLIKWTPFFGNSPPPKQ